MRLTRATRRTDLPPGRSVRRLAALSAFTLGLTVLVAPLASPAYAVPNDGTIKVDNESANPEENNNEPKLACGLFVELFGFDDSDTATVSFAVQGGRDNGAVVPFFGPASFAYDGVGDGAGEVRNTFRKYDLDVSGFDPSGEYVNVKVTVTNSDGGSKTKVFEVLPCPPVIPVVVDLAVDKTGPATATAGGTGTYTIVVSNVGTAAVTDQLVVTDTLPTGEVAVSASGGGFACAITNGGATVTCTNDADLAAGASTGAITVGVSYGIAATGALTDVATVGQVTGETNLRNNRDEVTTTIRIVNLPPAPDLLPAPDLAVDKTGPANGTAGLTGTYTILAKNVGTVAVTEDIVVTDTLPTGETAISATGLNFTCVIAPALVTCTRTNDLPAMTDADLITVVVAYAANASGNLVDTARVVPVTGETVRANNEDQVTTKVRAAVVNPINPINPISPIDNPVTPVDNPVVETEEVVAATAVVAPPQAVGVLPVTLTRPITAPPAKVLPFVVTAPVPAAVQMSVTPAAAPVAQAAPVTQARPAALPFTGSDSDTLLTTAIGLLMLGCAFVAAGRRRKTVSIG